MLQLLVGERNRTEHVLERARVDALPQGQRVKQSRKSCGDGCYSGTVCGVRVLQSGRKRPGLDPFSDVVFC